MRRLAHHLAQLHVQPSTYAPPSTALRCPPTGPILPSDATQPPTPLPCSTSLVLGVCLGLALAVPGQSGVVLTFTGATFVLAGKSFALCEVQGIGCATPCATGCHCPEHRAPTAAGVFLRLPSCCACSVLPLPCLVPRGCLHWEGAVPAAEGGCGS